MISVDAADKQAVCYSLSNVFRALGAVYEATGELGAPIENGEAIERAVDDAVDSLRAYLIDHARDIGRVMECDADYFEILDKAAIVE